MDEHYYVSVGYLITKGPTTDRDEATEYASKLKARGIPNVAVRTETECIEKLPDALEYHITSVVLARAK